jgi:tetratricopeptide (TPR) repeat protein
MLLAFAALYGKAPRFWQNSERQPTIAGINLQPPAPQRTLPELLTPSVGGFAQADVALQARAEPVAGRNTGASRPANSRGPEHRSSSEPYSALKTREPSRQSGDDPSLAGRKSSTDGEPSTVNTRVEPATAPENARVAARAAAATGRSEAAASAYARAVAAAPLDTDLLLEAARYNASVGQAANAVALYQSYLSMRPATGLSLELTRTALAAQRPELAVEWAEAGVAGGDRGSDLQYAYAQALHLSDRPAAAAAILQKLLVGDPHNGDWLLWLAYTAQARGRSVEAYELLRAAIDAGTTPAGNLWLTRGDVAAQWGDVLRAKKDYERARSSGADPEAVSSREQKLSDQLSPQIAVPGEVLGDSNGVEFAQGAVTFFLQPTASGRFSGTWASGQISQRGYGFSTRAARVDMDDAFVSTRLQLRAGGGVQQNADETLATWHGGGTYRFARGGSLAADAIRDTPWSRQLEANPLRFNRVIDLAALGPGFHFT